MPGSAKKGFVLLGVLMALAVLAVLAAALCAAEVRLAARAAFVRRDAQAHLAAATGLERLKPLCGGYLAPGVRAGTVFSVSEAAGPVGDGRVTSVTVKYEEAGPDYALVLAEAEGECGGRRAAVWTRLRAEFGPLDPEDPNSEIVLKRVVRLTPYLRVAP